MEQKKVASNNLALRRLAALEKGDFQGEGCDMLLFLVGDGNTPVKEIRACKFDLLVASEYFQGLLRSPLTPPGPIRIRHVEPEIFRLVVEFTHLSGRLVTEVNSLEQWLKLAEAADEFLLDDLGQLCTKELGMLGRLITLDNVWPIFNQSHLIKYASAVCEQLLSSKTVECLKQPAFLKISEKALEKFLNLKFMSISTEMELVRACLKFVMGKNDERAVFRRCALPHLRLLTLSADDDLVELAPFLDMDERLFLSFNLLGKDPLLVKYDLNEAANLCKDASPRRLIKRPTMRSVIGPNVDRIGKNEEVFLPYDGFLDSGEEIVKSEYHLVREDSKFFLRIEAHDPIRITGFDILNQRYVGMFEGWKPTISPGYQQDYKWLIGRRMNIRSSSQEGSFAIQHLQTIVPRHFGTYSHIEHALFLQKGGRVEIEVIFTKDCYVRKMPAKTVSGPKVTCSSGMQNNTKFSIFKSLYYQSF